jgi:hypothetical protein
MVARFRAPCLLVACAGLVACTGLADDLRRAEVAFTQARYEDVEVWLDALAPDIGRMEASERTRYYYFAGMSAYRIGERTRARHALALCREELALSRTALPSNYQRNLHAALEELTRAR